MHFVALRKESVDRNLNRRFRAIQHPVALRKESVDRNDNGNAVAVSDLVALRKESVDRNTLQNFIDPLKNGRSPQGERG